MESHSFSEPRPVIADPALTTAESIPSWLVDVLRQGVTEPVATLLINAETFPPRKRKSKVVWKLPDQIHELPRFGQPERKRLWELYKAQRKERRKKKGGANDEVGEEGSGGCTGTGAGAAGDDDEGEFADASETGTASSKDPRPVDSVSTRNDLDFVDADAMHGVNGGGSCIGKSSNNTETSALSNDQISTRNAPQQRSLRSLLMSQSNALVNPNHVSQSLATEDTSRTSNGFPRGVNSDPDHPPSKARNGRPTSLATATASPMSSPSAIKKTLPPPPPGFHLVLESSEGTEATTLKSSIPFDPVKLETVPNLQNDTVATSSSSSSSSTQSALASRTTSNNNDINIDTTKMNIKGSNPIINLRTDLTVSTNGRSYASTVVAALATSAVEAISTTEPNQLDQRSGLPVTDSKNVSRSNGGDRIDPKTNHQHQQQPHAAKPATLFSSSQSIGLQLQVEGPIDASGRVAGFVVPIDAPPAVLGEQVATAFCQATSLHQSPHSPPPEQQQLSQEQQWQALQAWLDHAYAPPTSTPVLSTLLMGTAQAMSWTTEERWRQWQSLVMGSHHLAGGASADQTTTAKQKINDIPVCYWQCHGWTIQPVVATTASVFNSSLSASSSSTSSSSSKASSFPLSLPNLTKVSPDYIMVLTGRTMQPTGCLAYTLTLLLRSDSSTLNNVEATTNATTTTSTIAYWIVNEILTLSVITSNGEDQCR